MSSSSALTSTRSISSRDPSIRLTQTGLVEQRLRELEGKTAAKEGTGIFKNATYSKSVEWVYKTTEEPKRHFCRFVTEVEFSSPELPAQTHEVYPIPHFAPNSAPLHLNISFSEHSPIRSTEEDEEKDSPPLRQRKLSSSSLVLPSGSPLFPTEEEEPQESGFSLVDDEELDESADLRLFSNFWKRVDPPVAAVEPRSSLLLLEGEQSTLGELAQIESAFVDPSADSLYDSSTNSRPGFDRRGSTDSLVFSSSLHDSLPPTPQNFTRKIVLTERKNFDRRGSTEPSVLSSSTPSTQNRNLNSFESGSKPATPNHFTREFDRKTFDDPSATPQRQSRRFSGVQNEAPDSSNLFLSRRDSNTSSQMDRSSSLTATPNNFARQLDLTESKGFVTSSETQSIASTPHGQPRQISIGNNDSLEFLRRGSNVSSQTESTLSILDPSPTVPERKKRTTRQIVRLFVLNAAGVTCILMPILSGSYTKGDKTPSLIALEIASLANFTLLGISHAPAKWAISSALLVGGAMEGYRSFLYRFLTRYPIDTWPDKILITSAAFFSLIPSAAAPTVGTFFKSKNSVEKFWKKRGISALAQSVWSAGTSLTAYMEIFKAFPKVGKVSIDDTAFAVSMMGLSSLAAFGAVWAGGSRKAIVLGLGMGLLASALLSFESKTDPFQAMGMGWGVAMLVAGSIGAFKS